MGNRPLAVVQFGEFGNGTLPTYVTALHGWGAVSPVNMHQNEGEWTEFPHPGITPWVRQRGRVVDGRFSPPPATPIPPLEEDRIVDACQLILDTPTPATGRFEAQLAVDPTIDTAALAILGPFVIMHSGIGIVSVDGTCGVALFRTTLQAGIVTYWWTPTDSAVQAPLDTGDLSATFTADDLTLAIDWVDRQFTFSVGDKPVCDTRMLPVRPADLRPMLLTATYGSYPDWSGVAWAALSETAPLPARPDREPATGRPGWTLLAASRDDTPTAEIGEDTFTWTQRLGETDTLTWSRATPGGPTIRPGWTHVHLNHDGRRMFAGVVGQRTRSHNEDGALPRQWQAKGRRGQLDTVVAYPTHRLVFNNMPLRQVLEQLLDDTQSLPGGDMGIRIDPDMADGPAITLTIAVRDQIGSCIDKAVELAGGEWTIDRRDLLRWWPNEQGAQRDFLVDAGGAALSIDETTDPAGTGTALWVTGTDPAIAVYRQHPSIVALGRTDLVISDPDEPHGPTLVARADRYAQTRTVLQGSYTATLRPDMWTPGRLGVGDVAHVIDPSLELDDWLRVFEIAVTVNGDGMVDVKATFGAPPPSFIRRIVGLGKAVERLQRR